MPSEAQRQQWGEAIFPHIPAGPAATPIQKYDLAAEAHLSSQQVAYGVGWLRDQFPDLPLCSTRQGYWFTDDQAQVEESRARLGHQATVVARRTWTGIVQPYLRRQTDPRTLALLTKVNERMLADLSDILTSPLP
jgi:hypothetical protein